MNDFLNFRKKKTRSINFFRFASKKNHAHLKLFLALFPSPPPHMSISFMEKSDFTRLIMNTKYVCHGLSDNQTVILIIKIFHDNRTMRTVILMIKSCRWGKRQKRFVFNKWKLE